MAEKTFRLEIAAPERTFYKGDAVMVELNTTEGEVGIYADHIPMTLIIAPGVMTITEPAGKKKAALISGFMEVKGDEITILAETAEWPDEIDKERVQAAKQRAKDRILGRQDGVDIARAEAALKRALAREKAVK